MPPRHLPRQRWKYGRVMTRGKNGTNLRPARRSFPASRKTTSHDSSRFCHVKAASLDVVRVLCQTHICYRGDASLIANRRFRSRSSFRTSLSRAISRDGYVRLKATIEKNVNRRPGPDCLFYFIQAKAATAKPTAVTANAGVIAEDGLVLMPHLSTAKSSQ